MKLKIKYTKPNPKVIKLEDIKAESVMERCSGCGGKCHRGSN